MNKIMYVTKLESVPLLLGTLMVGMFLTIAANSVSNRDQDGRDKVSMQIPEPAHLSVEKPDNVMMENSMKTNNRMSEHTMGLPNENVNNYAHRPFRALQIPGHVLEAITSNMGTELITID